MTCDWVSRDTMEDSMTAPTTIDLDGSWELACDADGPWHKTVVPGNWWLDGIDGPETVWYRRRVAIPADWAGRHVRLRIGAADYRATVVWDGNEVGSHTGGFAPFVVGVPGVAGDHELVVRVDCPTDPFGEVWPHTKTTVRGVMGHHDARPGGWSARGQERSTGGLWGSVSLGVSDTCVIDTVRFTTAVRGADADVHAVVVVDVTGDEPVWATVRATLTDPDQAPGDTPAAWRQPAYELWTETWLEPGRNEVAVRGPLAAPRLWWTWDHGEPYRYRLATTVDIDGVTAAGDERLVGVRSIEVGDDWVWHLNGRPVFIRGMNYIGEQWLSTLTAERAAADVALATGANLNALRVHAHVTAPGFYDACDAAGVLVWQDLPMQWGYADTAETYRVTRTMVRELVDLHGWRPSVAYWCAHNEAPWNEPWMAEEAGRYVADQNQRLDHELAGLFRRLDPSRPALANSGAGDGHTYPGWYWGTWRVAAEIPGGAFVTEYGAQAVPCLATLRTYLADDAGLEDWSFHGFQHHENSTHVGVTLLTHSVSEIIEATQHYQARLLQFATEHYRRRKRERVQGIMPFMLVDPWPCISWSVVDHLRVPKAGYHAIARAMQPVLPSIEAATDTYASDDPFGSEPVVFGIWWINDLHHAFRGAELSWTLVDAGGTPLESGARLVDVFADGARRVLQAGPFDLGPGRYAIESRLTDADGVELGTNRWDFTVQGATP
jgi:beta-mannosidase